MSSLFQGSPLSGARQVSPYGGLPFELAFGQGRQMEGLSQLLGFGPRNPQQARHQADLLSRGGPLAAYAQQVQGLAPGVIPEATAAGEQVASRGSEAFQTLTQQIQNALQLTGQAGQYAQTFGHEAFDPALETPFYREAFRRAVEPERGAAAARGLLESGPGQAGEDALARELTTGFSQQQLGMQGQVPGMLTNVGQAGVGAAGAGLDAVSQLGQALSARYGMPLSAASSLLQTLQSQQSPALQLLGLTSPHDRPFSGTGKFGAQKTG